MPSTEELNYLEAARDRAADSVPLIDVGPLLGTDADARRAVVASIDNACRETGFFCIESGCIAPATVQAVRTQMQRFFALVDDDPLKRAVYNRSTPGGNGWGPLYEEPAYQQGTIAHVESFDCGPRMSAFAADENTTQYGIYPSLWPDLPGFRTDVRRYWDEASRLGAELFRAFADMLGLERDYFASRSGERAPKTLRLLNYPGSSEIIDDPRHVGIAAHTDFECFTLMYQTAPGLELRDVHGHWYRAPSDRGQFTVIIGDMLERWTNGLLQATGHRVAITPWQRYSIILFFAANPDCVIAPLPQFVSANRPARYEPTTQHEHIRREMERAHRYRAEAAR